MTVMGWRHFAGIVNVFKFICPELQRLLKQIYDLARKGRQFIWGGEQQIAFDKIKRRLVRPPVLNLPDNKGGFYLYSNTSQFATGSALYQIQNDKPKLIAYVSKRLPEVVRNYSIPELEMWCIPINMARFDI